MNVERIRTPLGQIFTPENFPNGSCFVLCDELHIVLEWTGDLALVFCYNTGTTLSLVEDTTSKDYLPVPAGSVRVTY